MGEGGVALEGWEKIKGIAANNKASAKLLL